MDDGLGFALILIVIWAWLMVMVALVTSINDPYCSTGQAEIKDGQGNITQCVILPPPVPPGYVLPPGVPAPGPVYVAPLVG